MPARVTGMISGMDTESLIQDLVKAKGTKVEKLKKDQKKMTWKQEKWNDLNKKLKSLQSNIVGNLRWSSSYMIKKTKTSNEDAVSVITGKGAMNSVQKLSVNKLASSGYLTGGKLSASDGTTVTDSTLVSDLALKDKDGNAVEGFSGITGAGSFSVTVGGKSTTIEVDETTKMSDIVRQLNSAGVSANFDEKNQRLFIGAKTSGKDADFTITANNANGASAMSLLGINAKATAGDAASKEYAKLAEYYSTYGSMTKEDAISSITSDVNSDIYKLLKNELKDEDDTDYEAAYDKLIEKLRYANTASASGTGFYNEDAHRLVGEDAEIELNGVTFTSATNSVEVNGLTFQCHAIASDISITTEDDTDGIYDMIKNFVSEYNKIINEMDALYNAESVRGFEPLTDDEKEAMSDSEVEKYEDKVKGGLFRKDDTLGLVFNGMRDIMAAGYEVDGTKMYLSDFGINTLSYFTAADHEKNAFHIDGNSDDSDTAGNADKLKTMIASDPEKVVSFFSGLAEGLYKKMSDLSATSETSSFGSFFDDKQMKKDLTSFESKIAEAQEKLNAYEDKFYAKFAAMEKALAKSQSSTSYLSGLFGGQQ